MSQVSIHDLDTAVGVCFWRLNECASSSGVESLVGWLLDHPDVHVTEVSDAETVSDEYSDEEVLEELEEAEPPFPAVSVAVPLKTLSQISLETDTSFPLVTSASGCSRDGEPNI